MPFKKKLSIMIEEFPNKYNFDYKEDFENYEFIRNLVEEIREIKGIFRVQNRKDIKLFIHSETKEKYKNLVKEHFRIVKFLAGIESFSETNEKLKNSAIIVFDKFLGFLILENYDFEKERKRLESELETIEKLYHSIKEKLNDDEFLKKAPEQVIENQKNKLLELESKMEKLKRILKN
jgi:valyl-tRNA synthetase